MPNPPLLNPPSVATPFLVEHRQRDRALSGSFQPEARLVLLPALRTSGLWSTLAPEDIKNLLLLLTFLSPNGDCHPTLLELAEAMQVSQAKAHGRMLRLAQQSWQGKPLVTELPRPDGMDAYAPGRQLLTDEQIPPPESASVPVLNVAGRGAVIAHSRAAYAAPRAEVERDIAERMGWGPPAFEGDDPAVAQGKRQAYEQLTTLGVPREQALDLLARFDLARVERQLAWLSDRHAKSPARFLAAAIEGDYEMPPHLRRRVLLEAALREQADSAAKPTPLNDVQDSGDNRLDSGDDRSAQDGSTIYHA